jgi:hypothetical protein
MRKLLLTTVAVAAVVGVAGVASAQTMQAPSGGNAAKPESTEHQAPGAMGGAIKGNINGPGAAKSAQTPAQGTKPNQTLGQDEKKQMTPQRGAQEEKPGTQEQRGAQEEKSGTQEQHRAQEEKSGTQEQRGAQEENAKSGTNAGEQNASKTTGSHGAVQLSETQRTKIQTIIGHSRAARVTNVKFNVEVGVRIPRTVHVEVVPEDIVEVVPQFRGFDYIIVGDNILIIDPDTLEIVDIIAA